MDHLVPKSTPLSGKPAIIPYLGSLHPGLAFDPERDTFEEFPERLGIDTFEVSRGILGEKTEEEVLCIIQSWCFFGLLFSAIKASGLHYNLRDFLSDDATSSNGKPPSVISTVIPDLIRRMEEASRLDSITMEQRTHVYFQILESLTEVSTFLIDCNTLSDRHSFLRANPASSSDEPSLRDLVMLSVMTLGETLYTMLNGLWLAPGDEPEELMFGKIEWIGYLKPRLVASGWCRSQVNLLNDQGAGLCALYYLSMLDQTHLGNDHQSCGDTFLCKYETLNVRTYETKHGRRCLTANESEKCSLVEVNDKQKRYLIDLVQKERTPLITVSHDAANKPAITFTSSSMDTVSYVCISHVWQDGLGNPKQNALQSCQLRQIQEWVDSLYDDETAKPVPFWIDTICVPLEPEFRKLAISHMFSIYRHAEVVLVLEAGIMAISSSSSDPSQLFLSIRSSNWMRRLWTFQEGLLAQELYFQFSDKALDITDMVRLITNQGNIADSDCSEELDSKAVWERLIAADVLLWNGWDWLNRIYEIKPFERKDGGSIQDRIDEVLLLLCWRNTSWTQDEPYCYSLVLGLDPVVQKQISQAEPADRMKLLVNNLKTINANVLFVNRPRLQEEGLRWMPTSFLGGGRQSGMLNTAAASSMVSYSAQITPLGLKVYRAGLIFHGDVSSFENFQAADEKERSVRIISSPEDTANFEQYRGRRLAVLLKLPLNSVVADETLELFPNVVPGSTAALVEVKAFDPSMIIVSYIQLVGVFPTLNGMASTTDVCKFEAVSNDQLWLVQ